MSCDPEIMETAARETLKNPETLTKLEDIRNALVFARTLTDKSTDEDVITQITRQYFQQIQEGKCKFLVIKNYAGELVATGCVQDVSCLPDFAEEYGSRNVYLRDQAISPDFQGKKDLGKKITDARLAEAKKMGCDQYAYTEVDKNNYRSLIAKFKDGFVAVRFERYAEDPQAGGCLLMRKRIDQTEEYDKKTGSIGELKEVSLSDLRHVFNLMENGGWVGIDIKNHGDVANDDPDNWSLILEKN